MTQVLAADYGLRLDRGRALFHMAAIGTLVAFARWPWPADLLLAAAAAAKIPVAVRPSSPKMHMLAGAATVALWLALAAWQALAGDRAFAVACVIPAYDTWAYHLAALRRVAFFRSAR